MNDKDSVFLQPDEDVLAAAPHRFDAMAGDQVREQLRFRMTHDGRESQLAADDRATDEVRPQVRRNGLDLRKLRHPASGGRREIRRRGGPDSGKATSNA